ncbi:hypothetical protein WJ44_28450 [Burkholderia ubonensis]|nr:hypothetical protein WJ44_28450 [Burkholderia ubonensis]
MLSTLAMGAASAHADTPSAELKVIGSIDAPTCTVNPVNDGVYDFGPISNTLIKLGNEHTALDPITQTWTVSCDSSTYLTFTVEDNRKDTASIVNTTYFGLGSVNDTGKLGYYTVKLKKPQVDGSDARTFAGTSPSNNTETPLYDAASGLKHGWSTVSGQLQAGTVFTADLEVSPMLGGSGNMNGVPTERVDLDGSLTLTFSYGL